MSSEENPYWTSQWIVKGVQLPAVASAPRGEIVDLAVGFEKGDVIRWDAETKEFWIRKSSMSGIEGQLALQLCSYFEPDENGKLVSSTIEAPKPPCMEQARALVLASMSRGSLAVKEELLAGREVIWTVG